MSGIHVYNKENESHSSDPHNYYIGRGSILGNPYTHIKDRRTKALYVVPTRDDAIDSYSEYFDVMYSGNEEFRMAVDKIYDDLKNRKDVYLECYCHPQRCHGDIIKEKLMQRLIKEKFLNK